MTDEPPDGSVLELLRREALEETEKVAYLAEDYARMLFEAAERRDLMAIAVRLQQLRFCTIAMIQTFNLFLRKKPDGQGVAEARKESRNRADQ
jgi:hypothetical protein